MGSSNLPQEGTGRTEQAEIAALGRLARRLEHQVSTAGRGPQRVLPVTTSDLSAVVPELGAFAEAEELRHRYRDALRDFAAGLGTLQRLLASLSEECARVAGTPSASPAVARPESAPTPRAGVLRPVERPDGQEAGTVRSGAGEEAA